MVVWLLSTAIGWGGTTLNMNTFHIDDAIIESAMRCHHIPGLTLSVVSKDNVILEKGYGRTGNGEEQVTPHTLFPIASTTKAFTVTLLAILLQNKPSK